MSVLSVLPPGIAEYVTEEMVDSALLSKSLYDYVMEAWQEIEPTAKFIANWHIGCICEHLQAVSAGQIENLLINVPPGCSKSLTVSVFWDTWVWTRRPETRWFYASYDEALSVRDSLKARNLINTAWYQRKWGHVYQLSGDQNLKTRFENSRLGYRLATSVAGHGIGEHPDYIVVDDPHDPEGAESDVQRQAVINWWDQTMSTRGVSRGAKRVIIMQRLHEEDLSGHVLRGGDYVHICLPMRYEPKRMVQTPLGWNDPRTVPGELLAPEQFSEDRVRTLETKLGSYGAAGQLQQRPTPDSGGAIKRTWWRYFDAEHPPEDLDREQQSWDLSFKDLATSDPVVGQRWGRRGAVLYLLDSVRGRMNFPETLSAIRNASFRWKSAVRKLIEAKANGQAVIDTLRHELPGIIPVEVPAQSKEARVAGVSPVIEAGNVLLPGKRVPDSSVQGWHWEPAFPWVADFIEECAAFPLGANDDQVDAMSQAIADMMPALWSTKRQAWDEAKKGPPPRDNVEARLKRKHEWMRKAVERNLRGQQEAFRARRQGRTGLPGLGD